MGALSGRTATERPEPDENAAASRYKYDESPKKETSAFAVNVFSLVVYINTLLTYINETCLGALHFQDLALSDKPSNS